MTDDKMREAYETQLCPYRGSPDPWVVWQAAWKAAQARPVDAPTDAERPGWKWLKDSTHTERSWPEDAAHENGSYCCTCVICLRQFVGHKRRGVCKVCDAAMRATTADGGEG